MNLILSARIKMISYWRCWGVQVSLDYWVTHICTENHTKSTHLSHIWYHVQLKRLNIWTRNLNAHLDPFKNQLLPGNSLMKSTKTKQYISQQNIAKLWQSIHPSKDSLYEYEYVLMLRVFVRFYIRINAFVFIFVF